MLVVPALATELVSIKSLKSPKSISLKSRLSQSKSSKSKSLGSESSPVSPDSPVPVSPKSSKSISLKSKSSQSKLSQSKSKSGSTGSTGFTGGSTGFTGGSTGFTGSTVPDCVPFKLASERMDRFGNFCCNSWTTSGLTSVPTYKVFKFFNLAIVAASISSALCTPLKHKPCKFGKLANSGIFMLEASIVTELTFFSEDTFLRFPPLMRK